MIAIKRKKNPQVRSHQPPNQYHSLLFHRSARTKKEAPWTHDIFLAMEMIESLSALDIIGEISYFANDFIHVLNCYPFILLWPDEVFRKHPQYAFLWGTMLPFPLLRSTWNRFFSPASRCNFIRISFGKSHLPFAGDSCNTYNISLHLTKNYSAFIYYTSM